MCVRIEKRRLEFQIVVVLLLLDTDEEKKRERGTTLRRKMAEKTGRFWNLFKFSILDLIRLCLGSGILGFPRFNSCRRLIEMKRLPTLAQVAWWCLLSSARDRTRLAIK